MDALCIADTGASLSQAVRACSLLVEEDHEGVDPLSIFCPFELGHNGLKSELPENYSRGPSASGVNDSVW
jgi:hypothetical protein